MDTETLVKVLDSYFTQINKNLIAKGCLLQTPSDSDPTVDHNGVPTVGLVVLLDPADDGLVVHCEDLYGNPFIVTLNINEVFPVLVRKIFATDTTAISPYLLYS